MDSIETIRDLMAQRRYNEADREIQPLLALDRTNPILLAYLAEIYTFTGREEEAVWVLDRVPAASELRQVLADHFTARITLNSNDADASACLTHLGINGSVGVRVSACLIVKNEEATLPRCLESLSGAVDEIVVVDTGSTDRTIEVALDHGALVGEFEWIEDFSAARNFALDLATGDWVLWIDADEELALGSRDAIRQATCRPQFGGFNAEIVNYTEDGSDDAVYIHHAVRLFRRDDRVRFSGRIHEQLTPSLEAADLVWANLPGFKLLHHGYRPSLMAEKGKLERTVRLLEAEVRAHPNDAFHWFNLANAYIVGYRWSEAEHAARMCAKHLEPGSQLGALNYQFLITALYQQGRNVEALQVCDEAVGRGFGGIFIDFERANVLFRVGNYPKALQAATSCCAAEWPAGTTGDKSIYDSKRWILRGQILASLAQYDEALAMFDKCPDHPMSIYSKAATLEKAGRPGEALEIFQAGRSHGEIAYLCLKGAGACCMTLGLPKPAAEFYKQAWEMCPDDYDAWAQWAQACDLWGDLPSILGAYEAFAQRKEPNSEILINWGRALELSGENERALACYTEAIQRDPTSANAYFNAGDLLYKIGQYQDAAHLYQNGLKLTPANAQGWFVLGNSLAQLGIVQGARLGYEQALVIDPSHQAARHNLEIVAAG